jgi:hypothetical protein
MARQQFANVSDFRKAVGRPEGASWQAYPVEDIRKLLGNDWYRYAQDAAPRDSGCCSGFVRSVGIAAGKTACVWTC